MSNQLQNNIIMTIFKKKYFYRIDIETKPYTADIRNEPEVTFCPRAKLGRFGEWQGISSVGALTIKDECESHTNLCLVAGGVWFKDISCAEVFIKNFKRGLLRDEIVVTYLKR